MRPPFCLWQGIDGYMIVWYTLNNQNTPTMKCLFIAIAATMFTNACAQGSAVPEKGPKIGRVIELACESSAQLTLLRIEFQSDFYPVSFVFHGDTIGLVTDSCTQMFDLPVRYTLTEDFRHNYNLYVANRVGKEYIGTRDVSRPSIADALKK